MCLDDPPPTDPSHELSNPFSWPVLAGGLSRIFIIEPQDFSRLLPLDSSLICHDSCGKRVQINFPGNFPTKSSTICRLNLENFIQKESPTHVCSLAGAISQEKVQLGFYLLARMLSMSCLRDDEELGWLLWDSMGSPSFGSLNLLTGTLYKKAMTLQKICT